jgi:hypothetical protein
MDHKHKYVAATDGLHLCRTCAAPAPTVVEILIREDNTGTVSLYPWRSDEGNVVTFGGVTVMRALSIKDGRTLEPATVNAPSTGTVTPAAADVWSRVMREAADVARIWNGSSDQAEAVESLARRFQVVTKADREAYQEERAAARKARERRAAR